MNKYVDLNPWKIAFPEPLKFEHSGVVVLVHQVDVEHYVDLMRLVTKAYEQGTYINTDGNQVGDSMRIFAALLNNIDDGNRLIEICTGLTPEGMAGVDHTIRIGLLGKCLEVNHKALKNGLRLMAGMNP